MLCTISYLTKSITHTAFRRQMLTNSTPEQYVHEVPYPIEVERLYPLLDTDLGGGGPVVYWMQASQRVHDNLALVHAIEVAERLGVGLLVVFGLTPGFPQANRRHYHFMLQGLEEVRASLEGLGIGFAVRLGESYEAVTKLPFEPTVVIADAGYLREQRIWRRELVKHVRCRVIQVEDNVVVPIRLVSEKEEYAAYTIRPKINRHRERFLSARIPAEADPPSTSTVEMADGLYGDLTVDLGAGAAAVCDGLDLDDAVGPTEYFTGGTSEAHRLLRRFIDDSLERYADDRSDPSLHLQSNMSPYLHFGQVSPRWIAAEIRGAGAPEEPTEAFLEELIVRRELSVNFVYYNRDYRGYECLPGWALETLNDHRGDERVGEYSRADLVNGRTDDPYWNAAMREMRITGKMHNYMRMYWGKRFLEWHNDPQQAFEVALALNNAYFVDGRDPNSYAGVAWCFGKHDRPWQERSIFGKVRYMNANGLRRKFDIEGYVRWTESLRE